MQAYAQSLRRARSNLVTKSGGEEPGCGTGKTSFASGCGLIEPRGKSRGTPMVTGSYHRCLNYLILALPRSSRVAGPAAGWSPYGRPGGGRGACAESEQWTLRAVARCLIIRAAVIILPGVSLAVRLRLIYVLEHNRCGGNYSLFEGGEFGVGHIGQPFRDRIGRKMQIQGLRWTAITAV